MKIYLLSIVSLLSAVFISACSEEKKDVAFLEVFCDSSISVKDLNDLKSFEKSSDELKGGIRSYSFKKQDTTLEIHIQNHVQVMAILKLNSNSPTDSKKLVEIVAGRLNMKRDLKSDTVINGSSFSIYGNGSALMHVTMGTSGVTLNKMGN